MTQGQHHRIKPPLFGGVFFLGGGVISELGLQQPWRRQTPTSLRSLLNHVVTPDRTWSEWRQTMIAKFVCHSVGVRRWRPLSSTVSERKITKDSRVIPQKTTGGFGNTAVEWRATEAHLPISQLSLNLLFSFLYSRSFDWLPLNYVTL